MKSVAWGAAAILCIVATPAWAGFDDYGLGNGQDGLGDFAADAQINAYARMGRAAAKGTSELCLDNVLDSSEAGLGFQVDRLVLVHQSAAELDLPYDDGSRPDEQELGVFASGKEVGQYELGRIVALSGPEPECGFGVAMLDRPLIRSYSAPGAQVVTVPEFSELNLTNRVVASPWDPSEGRGGIVAFLNAGHLYGGEIDVSGMGFPGGTGKVSSGACSGLEDELGAGKGGGMDLRHYLHFPGGPGRRDQGGGGGCHEDGAGGGGHAGPGGRGGSATGDLAGLGGFGFPVHASPSYDIFERMLFGGGGGGGAKSDPADSSDGGSGGGIIFFRSDTLIGSLALFASGGDASLQGNVSGGGAGGGAGGTILGRFGNKTSNLLVVAMGGSGQNSTAKGGGGGGGGGRIHLEYLHLASSTSFSAEGGASGLGAGADGSEGGDGWPVLIPNEPFALPDAPTVSVPADGSTLTAPIGSFSGSAPAGGTVTIFLDGEEIGSTTVEPGGDWAFAPAEAIVPSLGHHQLLVFVTVNGISSSVETAFSYEAPPTLLEPAERSVLSPQTPFVIAGVDAIAGATVQVYVDGAPACDALALGDGSWSCEIDGRPTGVYEITLTQSEGGVTSPPGGPFVFGVGIVPAPIIEYPDQNHWSSTDQPTFVGRAAKGAQVEVVLDDGVNPPFTACTASADPLTGSWMCLSVPVADGTYWAWAVASLAGSDSDPSPVVGFNVLFASPPPPVIETPAHGSLLHEAAPLFAGSADPSVVAGVAVIDDLSGHTLCQVPVEWTGQWECRPTEALIEGVHAVVARSFSLAGKMSVDSAPVIFSLTFSGPPAPVIHSPLQGSWVADSLPTIEGKAPLGSQVTVVIDGGLACSDLPVKGNGSWQCVPMDALADGEHVVQAVARDAGGLRSEFSTAVAFRVETLPPPPPVILLPQHGGEVGTTTPLFVGNALAGALVRVQDLGGTSHCEVFADPMGQWSCTPLPLPEGRNDFLVYAVNPAGVASIPSQLFFDVDLSGPETPEILRPAEGSFTNETRPEISGIGEAGSFVQVRVDEDFVCSAVVDAAGSWSCIPERVLEEGPHVVEAWAEDGLGNGSEGSAQVRFTVHLAAPDAPVLTSPAAGSWLNTSLPSIEGSATPGLLVDVHLDGALVCPGLLAAGGTWACNLLLPLSDGSHVVSAVATDAAGNRSAPSPLVFFQVATTSPGAPAISAPQEGSRLASATPVIRGAAEPASLVWVHDEHDTPICAATAGATGLWSCTPQHPLAEGSYLIHAHSTDAAGNVSLPSPEVAFTVDRTAPAAPVILEPASGSVSNQRFPLLRGTAEVAARVSVEIDGDEICATVADESGTWSCHPAAPLADGTHAIRAFARDAAGNRSPASAPLSYTVETAVPPAPTILVPVDGVWLREPFPAFAGLALPGSRVDVDVDGQHACEAIADASGSWNCVSGLALGEGAHHVVATATSEAGVVSLPSAAVAFTVALTAPAAPAITEPVEGAFLADGTPLFRGHAAAAGFEVEVLVGGVPACTGEVREDGSWSCRSAPLAEGGQVAVAFLRDPAGNVSLASEARTFTVKTTAPVAPILLAPADGLHTAETMPLIAGSAEPFSRVEARVDGAAACQAEADAAGAWSCRPAAPLEEGSHWVQALASDAAGNLSAPSLLHAFTVLRTAPPAPVVLRPADGSHTRDPLPTLAGGALPGLRVEVQVDGASACEALADAGGDWSCLPALPFADGVHKVQAVAVDPAGNRSAASLAVVFSVTTVAPAAPTITAPVDGDFLATARPSVTGLGLPGGQVLVYDEDESLLCFAEVAEDGQWSCTPDYALADGAHRIHARVADRAGNVSAPSEEVGFTLLLEAPEAPVVLYPVQGMRTNERTPLVQGSASPIAWVGVEIDGAFACGAVADFNGDWSCRPVRALEEGMHELRAWIVDRAGSRSDFSAPLTFRVDLSAPATPSITEPAHGSVTAEERPLVAGLAPPAHDVEVYLDGSRVCEVRANGQGKWQCVPPVLSEGLHVAVALAIDPVGKVSAPSEGVTFTVSTAIPPAPFLLTPEEGGLSNEEKPRFIGLADPGLRVELRVDGALSCVGIANELGEWDCTATFPLRDGTYQAQAVARDEVGHPSEPTPPVTFTIDTQAPEAPVFNPPDGRRRPTTFEGSAEPGTLVRIFVDGEDACSAPVELDGSWACTAQVSGGNHRAVAVAVDAAGNESPEAERRFKVIQAEKVGGGGSGCSAGSAAGSASWLLPLLALLFLAGRRPGRVAAGRRRLRSAGRVGRIPLIALCLWAGSAHAQTRLPGFELDKLVLNPGARDSLILGSGDLLREGAYRLALSGHYQHDPLVFYTADGDRYGTVVGSRTGLHLSAAYGIFDFLEAGLQLPLILGQSGDPAEGIEPVATGSGLGTPYFQLRYGPLHEDRGSVLDLAFSLGVGIPLGAEEMLAREEGWMLIPQVEAGKVVAPWLRIGTRVGVAFRPSQTILPLEGEEGTELGHQVLAGLVLSTLGEGLRAEAGGQLDIPTTSAGRGGGELWGALRYPLAEMVEVYGLAGPGFGNSLGTPSFRGLVGLALGPQHGSSAARRMQRAPEPDPEALRRVREAAFAEGQEAGHRAGFEEGRLAGAASCPTCQEAPVAAEEPLLRERVYFALGEAELSPEAESVLARLGAMLRREPGVDRVIVEGHADPTGTREFNLELSRARAAVVRDRLMRAGVDAGKIELRAHGVDRALASNQSEAGRAFNRRAEVIVFLERSKAPGPVSAR